MNKGKIVVREEETRIDEGKRGRRKEEQLAT
jgi:hypothetical protein